MLSSWADKQLDDLAALVDRAPSGTGGPNSGGGTRLDVALGGGWLYGWSWLDPVMGIAGAILVALWARNLLRETGKVLLDREMDHPIVDEIRTAVESVPGGDHRVAYLHVWRVGKRAYACALSVVTHDATLTPDRVRNWLAVHDEVVHSTIEVHVCA